MNYPLKFNSTNIDATVNVRIHVTNETLLKMDEEFTVSLSFLRVQIPRVTLEPDNATVTIFEVDGEGK